MKTLTPAPLLFSATAQASLRDIAWDGFKAITIDTSIDVIQNLFKDKVTPQQVAALEQRVYIAYSPWQPFATSFSII